MLHGSSKPTRSDTRLFSRRLLLLRLVLFAGFAVLVARLAWLQIYQYDHYLNLSSSNRIRANFLTPIRGRIFDRHGQILATNQAAFSLEVLPDAANDIGALVDEVRQLIGLGEDEEREFYDRLRQLPRDGVSTTLLRENLNTKEVAIVASQLYRLDGLSIHNFLRRVYPDGPRTSAFLGHMGRITDRDWQRLDQKRYAWNGYIGKTGLEAQYEDILYGSPGYSYVEVDAHGRIHRELDREPASPGMDLRTSISLDLQRTAAALLEGHRGAVVAMVPATGEVLALYSAPGYDNNQRLSSVMHQARSEALADPLFNRAVSGVYPPASTVKPVLGLHPNLEESMPVTEPLLCRGHKRIGRRTFRDWKRSGHGGLDLVGAIAESCDVYFYTTALALGIEGLRESLLEFGYGSITGIDLPSEGAGLVPSAGWKLRRFDDAWRDGDTANTGIGQGFLLATPIQMAVATSVLANRGARVHPRLFRGWESPDTGASVGSDADPNGDFSPGDTSAGTEELVSARPVDLPERWQKRMAPVLEGMRAVIHSEKGTARRLAAQFEAAGIEGAGKTGTAQVVRLTRTEPEGEEQDKLKDHSLFIGFAPFENPDIAVAVVVENAGNGSAVAAPIGGRIMLDWLQRVRAQEESARIPQTGASAETDAGTGDNGATDN